MLKNIISNIIDMPRSTNKPVISKPVNSVVQHRPVEPNLFSSIKQGFGFGIGSSIAHNIFDSKEKPPHPVDKTREFKECMEKTYNYEECAAILK